MTRGCCKRCGNEGVLRKLSLVRFSAFVCFSCGQHVIDFILNKKLMVVMEHEQESPMHALKVKG